MQVLLIRMRADITIRIDSLRPQRPGSDRKTDCFRQADKWRLRACVGLGTVKTNEGIWRHWKARVHRRCRDIGALFQARPHLTDQDNARIQNWLHASTLETERDCHRTLPILARWGLVELLHLLDDVLHLLITDTWMLLACW